MGLGSRGGVGRYEQLLGSALHELEARGSLEWKGVVRGPHPEYLGGSPHLQRASDGSIGALLARITRSTLRWKPDVVYFTHVNLARLAPALRLLGIRAPYVVGTLGVEVWERLHWTKRLPLARARKVLAISDYTRARVINTQELPPSRCKTVHLALEDHWRVSADEHGSMAVSQGDCLPAPTSASLLSVCRLERNARDKGIDWVLRAVARLAPANPGLQYTVVGDGDDLGYLRDLATDLGIRSRVVFSGPASHEQLLAAYRESDLFVLPTRREGFGLVFLEAMAFRKPIIAVACAGTLDVVVSGEQGLLISSEHELPFAIEALLADPVRARQMGAAGHAAVCGRFSFDAFVSRLWTVLAEAAGHHEDEVRLDHRRPSGPAARPPAS